MDSNDTAQLIYLVMLGTVLAGAFVVSNRQSLGQTARAALLWGLIFIGVMSAYGLWQDLGPELSGKQVVYTDSDRIEVPRSRDGHYYLTLMADGVPIDFIVDTGATDIVLSKEDAARVGIDLEQLVYSGIAYTANGTVRSARATVDEFDLGGIVDRNVTVWVNEGELFGSLLGMEYLQRFSKIEIERGTLVLIR